MLHHRRSTCRSCGGTDLREFLSLGPTPLANAFLQSPAEFAGERSFPLDVFFCCSCSLVQLLDVIDPGVLFDSYIYLSGTSDTMAAHNRSYASTVVNLLDLGRNDLLVEVASNDGSLLRCFQDLGIRCIGVEPAGNVAEIARQRDIETVNRFFDSAAAREIRASRGEARVVVANNVLAHVDDPIDFLTGCKQLLGNYGMVIVEIPYVRELLDRLEYDTIYHEHLCYFSMTALLRLFATAGLAVDRVDRVPVHGGSLRVYARPATGDRDHGDQALALAREEERAELTSFDRYKRFARDVEENRRALRALLMSLKVDSKTIAGYGAPAKGNTLLNYCDIDTELLPFVVDKAPMKVGMYTPGSHIPVLAVEELLGRQPDYTMILAWNFADEIMQQAQTYRQRNGKFILPIPEPKIVN